jgi:hypothetical protein
MPRFKGGAAVARWTVKPVKTRVGWLLSSLLIILACTGCGSASPNGPGTDQPERPGLDSNTAVRTSVIHSANGAPTGIRISWNKSTGADVTGYHLYKDPAAIPDTARGDNSFWLRTTFSAATGHYMSSTTGSVLIAQPSAASMIIVDDIFAVTVGDTFTYRLTAVDSDGDESLLSASAVVIIAPFFINSLDTPSVGVGGEVVIFGDNLGNYDAASDAVLFPGVAWTDGTGFAAVELPAVVSSWSPTQIIAIVPSGATTGQLKVKIDQFELPTPEVFTNSDPYITGIAPLTGFATDQVIISGANFGVAANNAHFVTLSDSQLPTTSYVEYSDTQITCQLQYPGQLGTLPLRVRASGVRSNDAYFTLVNSAPSARLVASRNVALTPADITYNASTSSDIESLPNALVFDYDFNNDGNYELLNGGNRPPTQHYAAVGQYSSTVRVTDPQGLSGTASIQVDIITPAGLAQSGSTPAGTLHQTDTKIQTQYTISGGLLPYTMTWTLIDTTGVYADTVIAHDSVKQAGSGIHEFLIDTSTGLPVQDSNSIPFGRWQIKGTLADSTEIDDPDGSFVIPQGGGTYTVYRYQVAVVQDLEGDALGAAADELMARLGELGYDLPAVAIASNNVTLPMLSTYDAVLWAADGPHGTVSPFEWLSSVDTALLRSYLDAGGAAVIFGPPALSASVPFPNDSAFNLSYQPFTSVLAEPAGTSRLYARDFTSMYGTSVDAFDLLLGAYGHAPASGLYPGAVLQVDAIEIENPLAPAVAAIRTSPNAGGGSLYFGQFSLNSVQTVYPFMTVTQADLLDNIVAGTIAY